MIDRIFVFSALLVLCCSGCTWLNTPVGADPPEVTRPEETVTADPDSGKNAPPLPANSRQEPAAPEPPAQPVRPSSPSKNARPPGNPPDTAPVLTVRMSAEEESLLRQQIASDVTRANDAVSVVRQKALTREQAEDLSAVLDFLKSAAAARENDLRRAGTLAEKARVLAEELKSTVAR